MTTPSRKLRRLDYLPPGGAWFYVVPETGVSFEDRMSFNQLVAKVQAHYALNKLAVPENLVDLIHDFICSRMPPDTCDGPPPTDPPLTFFGVLGATELLFKRLLKGDKIYVTAEEANRRAIICSTCPNNRLHMCTTCNGLRDKFKAMVANRTTPYDKGLGVCAACGCGLSAKIHIDKKVLPPMPAEAIATLPTNCWARPEKDS